MCSEERKEQRFVSIVKDEDICVDFSRVEFNQEEETLELWLWVRNKCSEMIYVSLKTVCINNKQVYVDYALDEVEDGKGDYQIMVLCSEEFNEICDYSELKQIEFKVEIDDAEVKPLLWSNKVEILLDMLGETYAVNIEQGEN